MRRCSHISLVKNLNTAVIYLCLKSTRLPEVIKYQYRTARMSRMFLLFCWHSRMNRMIKAFVNVILTSKAHFIIIYLLYPTIYSRFVPVEWLFYLKKMFTTHGIAMRSIIFCFPGRYKKAVLVNVFQWFNKGDHLITIGQRRILERMGIQLIYHCFYPGRNCDFSAINKNDPELVST